MQFVQAAEIHLQDRLPLGRLALKSGALTMRQVFKVLTMQESLRRPFGRVAVEMGFLDSQDLANLLMTQADSAKPIKHILLDMGLLDQETINEELKLFYHEALDREEPLVAHQADTN